MALQPIFTSLQHQKPLSVRAADQIAQMILGNQFQVGSKIPSERQLALSLGVSRTVIREAIRLLESSGLVEVRTGAGTIVRGVSAKPVSQSINMLLDSPQSAASFDDVQAVRAVLEVATAELAAQRATDEDLQKLDSALERMTNAVTVEEHLQADSEFHLAIANATHNQVFVLVLGALNDVLQATWRAYWQAVLVEGESGKYEADYYESNAHHDEVLDAIRDRHPDEAQRAMTRMLEHWSVMSARVLGQTDMGSSPSAMPRARNTTEQTQSSSRAPSIGERREARS